MPISANVRFAIYRGGLPPPNPPEASDVAGHLEGAYADGQARADAGGGIRYTHVLLSGDDVDVRDDFDAFASAGLGDLIYVPDEGGTAFEVVYVERPIAAGFVRVFLNRRSPTWPTSDL